MPGDLEPALVRFLGGGAQLRTRDVHVGLERCCALVRPVVHHRSCVGRVTQRLDLRDRKAGPLEVWRGHVDRGAERGAGVDGLLDVEIRVAGHVAGSSHGGNAAGEIETREAEALFVVDGSAARWVEQMLVQHHVAWHDAASGEVERAGPGRDLRGRRVADGENRGAPDHDRLPGPRRRTGSVDDPNVGERDDRVGHADELSNALTGLLGEQRREREMCEHDVRRFW